MKKNNRGKIVKTYEEFFKWGMGFNIQMCENDPVQRKEVKRTVKE